MFDPKSIKLNPNNPRTISKYKKAKLKQSIKEFPEMLLKRPVVHDNSTILGGNMRQLTILELLDEGFVFPFPIERAYADASEFTEEQKRRFIVIDNEGFGEWDWEIMRANFTQIELKGWGFMDKELSKWGGGTKGSLSRDFIAPPFSILDTKQGYWRTRRSEWLDLGIQSELGREQLDATAAQGWIQRGNDSGGSIFDPVLAEIMYKWFCPTDGKILDPFAGGSVRGIVAGSLGYVYFGNDLSEKQIVENRKQAEQIKPNVMPTWSIGDSVNIKELLPSEYDFVFSCPPYFDLEVYSNDAGELSAMENYHAFIHAYEQIIANAVSMLKPNRFAAFVVTEIRDANGNYRGFVPDTIRAFEKAGMMYYNECILVNAIGSLPMRVRKQFSTNRKLGRMHQNVLIFYKGDTKEIRNNFAPIIAGEQENENE